MPIIKGNVPFNDYGPSDIIAFNIKSRLEYGLLELGAFTNINASGEYGTLERSAAKVFEGGPRGWAWESGVSVVGGLPSPYPVSGIYFNNTWTPVGTNASGTGYNSSWYVDYLNGRIIFSSGTSASHTVKCSYSSRDIAIYSADSGEFKTIMAEFMRRYNDISTQQPSGLASFFKGNRVGLPCIMIEVADANAEGYQLGGGEIQNFSVFFHVFSDTPYYAKRIGDLLRDQFQTTIDLYDINDAPFPLKYNGSLASGAVTYNVLGTRNSPYFWAYARINDVGGGSYTSDLSDDLYRTEIQWSLGVERSLGTY